MLSRRFYEWAAISILIFVIAYYFFIYPDGLTSFNPVVVSSTPSNFNPFSLNFQTCNSSGLFVGIGINQVPGSISSIALINGSIEKFDGFNPHTKCLGKCQGVGVFQTGGVAVFNFSGAGSGCTTAGKNYSAYVSIWYEYQAPLGLVMTIASGPVSGEAS